MIKEWFKKLKKKRRLKAERKQKLIAYREKRARAEKEAEKQRERDCIKSEFDSEYKGRQAMFDGKKGLIVDYDYSWKERFPNNNKNFYNKLNFDMDMYISHLIISHDGVNYKVKLEDVCGIGC